MASPMIKNGPPSGWQPLKHLGPLSVVVLLHIGFFYVLQNGLLQPVEEVMPKEIVATLITPPAPPQPPAPKPQVSPPKPQPVAPKSLPKPEKPLVKPAIAPPKPAPVPQAMPTPVEPRPAPAEPVAAAPAAPVAPAPAAPAPAAVPAPAQPRVVTSGVEYIQKPQPEYPALSRRMGEEGTVMLRILVNEKGRPEQVEVQKSSGYPRLDEAARQAALRAVFKPYIENGRAIPIYVPAPIRFQLDS